MLVFFFALCAEKNTVFMYSVQMLLKVKRLRLEGAILPKWRTALFSATPGHIVIRDYRDEIGNRWMRKASLLDPITGRDVEGVPPLLDAAVIRWETDYLVITGFERVRPNEIVDRFYDYQQTWYITPADE